MRGSKADLARSANDLATTIAYGGIMNNPIRRITPTKAQRDAIALAAVSAIGIAAVVAVYATWRFAKLVP